MGLSGSLLLFAAGSWNVKATESLEVEIDGVVLPVAVDDLGSLVRASRAQSEAAPRTELTTWMQLLDPESRRGLIRLLDAPVLTRRSLGQQFLRSWGARPLLDALGTLIRVDGGGRISSSVVMATLEQLLEQQEQITTLDVLKALPHRQLRLDLDALLKAADRWRSELTRHHALTASLGRHPSQPQKLEPLATDSTAAGSPRLIRLSVPHRSEPLQVEVWGPDTDRSDRLWVVLLPGLGGDPEHFHWLARGLSASGWPLALVDHPGSDSAAVQALLEGRQSFDGAEALRQRLADLRAVLEAQRGGQLPVPGNRVVLVGHSLGALTALLAAGAQPVAGADQRCEAALAGLPLTNLSKLLQCELAAGRVMETPVVNPLPTAVVGLNSFGGLIWPEKKSKPLGIPLLLIGGTLDLITPPLDEQLGLLAALGRHGASRAVVVEGASHFSPIRVDGQASEEEGDDLFQLGEELVGVNPLTVQQLIALELIRFLNQLEGDPAAGGMQHLSDGTTRWHRLDRSSAARLTEQLQ